MYDDLRIAQTFDFHISSASDAIRIENFFFEIAIVAADSITWDGGTIAA
jgi:hypothetical protein